MLDVKYQKVEKGYFVTDNDMRNLEINLERLDTYITILEKIVEIK